ncbi:MAG: TonB-dependent receptor [Burkholderiales bacterium]|nr:MAG: TonB-dependent receptor [Burkholderiales bacterium]
MHFDRTTLASMLFALGLLQAQPAHAQGTAAGGSGLLAPVLVTATRAPAAALGVPASVSVVEPLELEQHAPVRLGDAIADVPGVYVRGAALGASFPSSGQAVLSLRGIPRTPRTLVLVDGMPVNNVLSGGVNVAAIPFDAIERVEVVRGPYSALYGGNAMGGVVNFISAGADAPISELRVGAGSYGQRGAALVHRRRYESGLGVRLSLAYRASDGYGDSDYVVRPPAAPGTGTPVTGVRPTTTADGSPRWWVGLRGDRPWQQNNLQLALDQRLAAGTKLVAGIGLGRYQMGYAPFRTFLRDDAGNPVYQGAMLFEFDGPRRATVSESSFVTPTPSGETDRRLFARVEHRFADGSSLEAGVSVMRHRFTFHMPDFGRAGYETGTGQFTDQPNQREDFDLSLRMPMSERWFLVTGLALGHGRLERSTSALGAWRDAATRTALLNGSDGHMLNAALFVQSEHYFDHGLTAYLGGRLDHFETWGEVVQNTEPSFVQRYERRSFGNFSPKLALVWAARPWLSLRASYGEGFRPPALLDLYSRVASPTATAGVVSVNEAAPDLEPERIRAVEVGADIAFEGGARGSLTAYRQRLSDLIYRRRLSETLTRTTNAGAARVDGIEASLSWPTPVRGLSLTGALTHQFRYEITSNPAVPESVGKRLTDVPQTTASLGLRLERAQWTGLLAWRRVGHIFGSGDDLNENTVEGVYGSYDAHSLIDARLAWQASPGFSASLAIENLTDRRYFEFYRQPGRTVYAELAWRF